MNHIRISWKRLWWTFVLLIVTLVANLPNFVHPKAIPSSNQPAIVLDEHTLRKIQYIPQYHCLRYRKLDLIKRCRNSLYNDITKKLRKSFTVMNTSMEAAAVGNKRGNW